MQRLVIYTEGDSYVSIRTSKYLYYCKFAGGYAGISLRQIDTLIRQLSVVKRKIENKKSKKLKNKNHNNKIVGKKDLRKNRQ